MPLQFKSGALHFADDIGFLHKGLLLLPMVGKFRTCNGVCCDEISPFG
jgi:hypothetical protein